MLRAPFVLEGVSFGVSTLAPAQYERCGRRFSCHLAAERVTWRRGGVALALSVVVDGLAPGHRGLTASPWLAGAASEIFA